MNRQPPDRPARMASIYLLVLLLLPLAGLGNTNTTTTLETLPADFDAWRDPLTPVGYNAPELGPDAEQNERQQEREALAARTQWPALKLRGISHSANSGFLAILQDVGLVEVGDEIRIKSGDLIYTWRVDDIRANGITTTQLHVVEAKTPSNRTMPPQQE